MRVLMADRPEEDPGITVLTDIRSIFLALGTDRIASTALVKALHALDDGNSTWNEWRGRHDDRPPHELTEIELSHCCLLSRSGRVPSGQPIADREARVFAVT